jgi:hypothetical protein
MLTVQDFTLFTNIVFSRNRTLGGSSDFLWELEQLILVFSSQFIYFRQHYLTEEILDCNIFPQPGPSGRIYVGKILPLY